VIASVDVWDVAVVGGGPAGLGLASACERRGLSVIVVAEEVPWTQTLGTWVDDLALADDPDTLKDCLGMQWPIVTVRGVVEQSLHRPYAIFDNAALAAHLAPSNRMAATATGVTREADHHVVACADGSTIAARLVVDCGGARSALLARHRRGSVPVQSAYGVFTSGTKLVATDSFTMMDWSKSFEGHPTFLYAMDLGDGRSLVEETSLVGSEDVPSVELRRRLLERLGVGELSGDEEVVSIPMGGRLPERSTMVLGFGAAAGFIHPVTGYSVAASLRAVPRVADAIMLGISDGMRGPTLVGEMWQAVWPKDLVRTRALHDYGLAALRRLDTNRIGEFFDAFFGLPESDWSDYLRIDTPSKRVAGVMTRFFARMPPGIRLAVMGTSPRALGRLFARIT
jgi:lycopene cyclase-like protein